jgi:transcriptional regulator with XRE-family HTH domain
MSTKDFFKIFHALRKEKELTQDELSQKLGVSKSSIAMWETGQRLPSPDVYELIADFFNVDIDYLYGRTDIRQRIRFDENGNLQRTLTASESKLLDAFDHLNQDGQQKATEYIEDLAGNDKYKKDGSASAEMNIA